MLSYCRTVMLLYTYILQVENLNLLTDSNRLLREERESLTQQVSTLEEKARQLSDELQLVRESNRTLSGQKDALLAEKTALRCAREGGGWREGRGGERGGGKREGGGLWVLGGNMLPLHSLASLVLTLSLFPPSLPPSFLPSFPLFLPPFFPPSPPSSPPSPPPPGMRSSDGTLVPISSLNSTTKWTLKNTRDYCKNQ